MINTFNVRFLTVLNTYFVELFDYSEYHLFIVEAKAVIEGPSEIYIKAGSKLKLFCRYYNITERPSAVFW